MEQNLILIVDDDEGIIRMLRRRLSRAGYQTVCVNNGADGIAQALALRPRLILLDMHMPRVDGFEVIQTLREQDYTGLVAACSASVSVKDSEATLVAGCDYFISKPIDSHFEEKIQQILATQHG